MLLHDGPLTSQPQEAVEVDWGNPLAAGLLQFTVGPSFENGLAPTPNLFGDLYGSGRPEPTPGLFFGSFAEARGKTVAAFSGTELTALVVHTPSNVGASGSDRLIAGAFSDADSRHCRLDISGSGFRAGWRFGEDNQASSSAGIVAPTVGVTYAHVGRWLPGGVDLFINGALIASNATGSNGGTRNRISLGGDSGWGGFTYEGIMHATFWWSRALSLDEIRAVSANPWQLFRVRQIVLPAASAPSGVTGTSDVTFALGGSATGTVRVAGTSDVTLGLTGSASGAVRVQGASTVTLALTASATAVAPVRGTSAHTFALGVSSTGAVRVTGTSDVTFALTGSATGETGDNTATSNITFELTGSAEGRVLVRGSSDVTLAMGGSATGVVRVRGESAVTFALGGTATGVARVQGASAVAFALGGTASGAVAVRGTSAVTFAITGSATGTGPVLTLGGLVTAVLTLRSPPTTLTLRPTDATLTTRAGSAALTLRPAADAALQFQTDDPV